MVPYTNNFNVTVTQPTGQSCAVTSGSGTMPSATVTNVNVTCASLPYSLGGSVTGLAANTNVVLTNANDSLNIGGNVSFTFPTSVLYHSNYNVLVATQPNNQLCTVTSGSALMGNANVTGVSIACVPTYALSANVTGLALNNNIILKDNGGDASSVTYPSSLVTFPTRLAAGATYSVTVGTAPVAQVCTVTNGNGTMPSADLANVAVNCNLQLLFVTNQNALYVFGQQTFTTATSATNNNSLATPSGAVGYAANGDLFIPDTLNYRIVGYRGGVPTTNGKNYDFVVSQATFTSRVGWGAPSATQVLPYGISANGNIVVVGDAFDDRASIYYNPPELPATAQNLVVGQATMTTNVLSCGRAFLSQPRGVSITNTNQVLVADTNNSRVMIWSTFPTTTGQNADLELGQPDFNTCIGNSNATSSNLYNPYGVWSDGVHVLVADSGHNRIMIWNSFPTVNGQTADAVLGQPNFTTTSLLSGVTNTAVPASVTSDGNSIFVAEAYWSRTSQWGGVPWRGSTPAQNAVLGQVSNVVANCTTLINGQCQPYGVTIVGTALIVTDSTNNRILVYQSH